MKLKYSKALLAEALPLHLLPNELPAPHPFALDPGLVDLLPAHDSLW